MPLTLDRGRQIITMKAARLEPEPRKQIRIGPAGWSYADWQGIVYPSPRPRGFHEPAYLAKYFDTIEINTSFYQPLRPSLVQGWMEQIAFNSRFLFTAKLWQKFTHEDATTLDDEKSVRAGFDVLQDAGRLGAVLVQFPFSFHKTPETLARVKRLAKQFHDYPLVIEVRHSSWNGPKLETLLREIGVGLCNIDQPVIGRSVVPSERVTSTIGYVRLHGRRYDTWFTDDPAIPKHERYNYLYAEEELKPWAERIKKIATHAESTFVITNNHYQGKGVVNALDLIHLLGNHKLKIPEPLRQHYPALEKIASEPALEPTLFPIVPR
ncbi:MAG TPA: DUF72 domain-containing protein [Candidatus Acidoferrales bacterium]|nr:DUF72 domain-containing protein [Candidatus Acidoferrales bacterium]